MEQGGKGTVKRRSQAERSAEMRQRLCETTLDLLCEVGYERISTQMIAARAEVSRGAQTHHFPTKNDLLIGAMQHLLTEWNGQLQAFRAEPDQTLTPERYTRQLWTSVFSQPRYIAVIELMLAARGDLALRQVLQGELEKWTELRDAIFHQLAGSDLGEDKTSLFLQLNLCMLRGMAVQASFNRDETANQRLLDAWIQIATREFSELKKAG